MQSLRKVSIWLLQASPSISQSETKNPHMVSCTPFFTIRYCSKFFRNPATQLKRSKQFSNQQDTLLKEFTQLWWLPKSGSIRQLILPSETGNIGYFLTTREQPFLTNHEDKSRNRLGQNSIPLLELALQLADQVLRIFYVGLTCLEHVFSGSILFELKQTSDILPIDLGGSLRLFDALLHFRRFGLQNFINFKPGTQILQLVQRILNLTWDMQYLFSKKVFEIKFLKKMKFFAKPSQWLLRLASTPPSACNFSNKGCWASSKGVNPEEEGIGKKDDKGKDSFFAAGL